MSSVVVCRHTSKLKQLTLFLAAAILFALPLSVSAQERQINGGPYSLTLHGGALNDSGGVGMDLRADFLNPVLNVHIFGTYDLLDASSPIGEVDTQRYGAGVALSHTYQRKANIFAGTSFINELGEYFGHAYLGGKLKVSDTALITGSYGFSLGNEKTISKAGSEFTSAESVNWGKVGVTLVKPTGLKANLNYYLTDPGGQNISGIGGALSYPATENVTVGVRGGADLTSKGHIDKNWNGNVFLTYSFGGVSGSPIEVALNTNSPVEYPVVLRTQAVSVAASSLSLDQSSASAFGCSYPFSGGTVTFTASGGVQPYSWSSTVPGLVQINATQAEWSDSSDNFCSSSGTVTVTVTDADGYSASGIINVSIE